MTSPYSSPAFQPPPPAPPQRRIPRVFWALLIAACLISLVIGYAIGEYVAYMRFAEALIETDPNIIDT